MTAKSTENKTKPTEFSPAEFIRTIAHPGRRADALVLLDWFSEVTGFPAVMWGQSIVGYGRYHYEYESGRSGDFLMTGFSPRKSNLSVYIMPGYQDLGSYLERLGKHKTGAACLYINKLDDIDMAVLKEVVLFGIKDLQKKYQTWNR